MNNRITIPIEYENLLRLISDSSIAIEENRGRLLPSAGLCNVRINVPPSLKEITKAFQTNNSHKITRMILDVSTIIGKWLDLNKALVILDEALKTPLKEAIYQRGFFNQNKIVTCGSKLSKTRNFILAEIRKSTEKNEALNRFNNIKKGTKL